jgi:26S proteasome regulatory subunit N3
VAAAEALVASTSEEMRRRSLDLLRAKAWNYLSLASERSGGQAAAAALRPRMLAAHRTACLQHDEVGQATLLNLLLRSLLAEDQVEQAYKLVSKTNFPEKASNNQFCRYLYYTGRISALQLEYGDANDKLKSCLRKSPQAPGVAGFRRAVQKLLVIVSLLMGDVPERASFNAPDSRAALQPYLALTKAVREGSLGAFNKAVAAHKAVFVADKLMTLVVRLSHSVIKTGLRRINISYSRISMADICAKLTLDSPASAESVCAKAIRDGVIDAVIDHESGCLTSKARTNVYATNEPQRAFHQRVEFCLAVRNEAVKAMRYPDDAFKPKKKGDKKKEDEEIAKEIEDELDDEEM